MNRPLEDIGNETEGCTKHERITVPDFRVLRVFRGWQKNQPVTVTKKTLLHIAPTSSEFAGLFSDYVIVAL